MLCQKWSLNSCRLFFFERLHCTWLNLTKHYIMTKNIFRISFNIETKSNFVSKFGCKIFMKYNNYWNTLALQFTETTISVGFFEDSVSMFLTLKSHIILTLNSLLYTEKMFRIWLKVKKRERKYSSVSYKYFFRVKIYFLHYDILHTHLAWEIVINPQKVFKITSFHKSMPACHQYPPFWLQK